MKSYRTPPDVAVNHDNSIDSNNLPCPSNVVRLLPADVVGRSFVFSFCNDEDDVFCVVEGGRLDWAGRMPGKFRRNNREVNRSRKLMS